LERVAVRRGRGIAADPEPALRSKNPGTDPPIALIGPDGAGKTTILRDLASRLHRQGKRTRISWMRSPRILTLGVLGLLRLSGLAKTVRMGDHDDVHTDLSRHPMLLQLYAWSITFDYFLGYVAKVSIPRVLLHRTILLDRFAWDTLVDLGLASGLGERIVDLAPGKILLDVARRHPTMLVTASPEVLIRRKPILSLDPRLVVRLRLYETFARRFGLGMVDSGNTSESVSAGEAAKYFGIPSGGV
jgi:thymidylate kinase